MAVVLALAAALVYGAGDFAGGMATRRAPALTVVLASQVLGGLLLTALAFAIGGDPLPAGDVAWAAMAGVAGGGALALLYHGLATGVMSLVAPVTAVVAAAVPVLAGVGFGERPSPVAGAGMLLALGAIALISRPATDEHGAGHLDAKTLGLALAAGLGFGLFFIGLERTSDGTGLWPLVPARGAAALGFVGLVLATRTSLRIPAGLGRWIVAAAVCDTAANALYLLAVRRGLLAIVAVLTSLYPASTLVLARVVLGERLARVQRLGLAGAASAVVLISLG